jgi:peptide/nickel transport system permease protein
MRWMHGIPGFILRRVLLGLLTLLLVSIVVFAVTQTLPGDPARAILGRNTTPESLAELHRQLNLNKPAISSTATGSRDF